MERSDKAEEILDIAERMARQGGYNGFSFREIANAVGVKSASVHYHFPTKQDLAAAVARRYTANFLDALGAPARHSSAESAISSYIDAYRKALVNDGLMCLCGVMGAEIDDLPPVVRAEAKRFFEKNIDWLMKALGSGGSPADERARRERAAHIIATLEGAMILARSIEDNKYFDYAVKGLL